MTSFETLKERYLNGRISTAMLKIYIKKGIITQTEYETIILEKERATETN